MAKSADEVTAELVDWASGVLPGVNVNAPALGSPMRQLGFDLRLVRMSPSASTHGPSGPLAIDLDYLITVQLPDPAAEQAAVTELMFAALSRPDLEVRSGDAAVEACRMIGLPLAPGLLVRVRLEREAQAGRLTPSRRLTAPAAEGAAAGSPVPPAAPDLTIISGRVVGPGNAPIEGAMVEAAELKSLVRTDDAGRFRLQGRAGKGAAVRLVARAGDSQVEVVAVAGLPVTLRLPAAQLAPE